VSDELSPLLSVGFDVECSGIVNTTMETEVGPRPLGPTEVQRRLTVWRDRLEAVAREVHQDARMVMQPDMRPDRLGAWGSPWAIIWCRSEVDIDAMRAALATVGQYVGHVTLHYDPAMA
jgi:hypothetical protein